MLDLALAMFGDHAAMLMAVLVFLATTPLAFWAMSAVRVRGAVKRRAAGIRDEGGARSQGGARSLRHTSIKAAQRLLEYTTKHYNSADDDRHEGAARAGWCRPASTIRARSAISSWRAPRWRSALAAAVFIGLPMLTAKGGTFVLAAGRWPAASSAMSLPSVYIDRRIAKRARRASVRLSRISWICWWCAPIPA